MQFARFFFIPLRVTHTYIIIYNPYVTPHSAPLILTPKSVLRKTKPIVVKIISNLKKIISNVI